MTDDRHPLLLDLAGVLLRFEPAKRTALIAQLAGRDIDTIERLLAADGIGARLDTGRADDDELAATLTTLVGRTVDTDEAWSIWLTPFTSEPAVFDALPALRAHFRLGLFTNNARAITRVFDASPFEWMFFSSELGATKPDPGCYDAVTRALGVPAGAIVFVDDGPGNVAAGRRAGWRSALFASGDALGDVVDAALAA